ncbi:MAG: T9SS type A sorting domain-containing protein [Bacteroidetes bacterium]|nr:T9SS type A sorting domain-containing protein [Bacteroidota bacterium]
MKAHNFFKRFFRRETIGLLSFLLLSFSNSYVCSAAVRTSTATGGLWSAGGTWVGGTAPVATDDAIIATTGGNAVTLDAALPITNFTINNGAIFISGNNNLNVSGNIVLNGLYQGNGTGRLVWSGNAKTWDGVGTLDNVNRVDGFAATTKTILATANITFTGANQRIDMRTTNTITNNGTVTLKTITDAGTATSVWVNGANATLNISEALLSSAAAVLTATAAGNTVNYNGSIAQTIKATSYYHLKYTGSNTGTLGGNTNIAGDFTVSSGTFAPSTFTTTFNGTAAAQNIYGGGTFTFQNLTLNNTYGTMPQLIFNTNVTTKVLLTMTSGVVNLAGNIFTLGVSATASTLTRTASTTTNWFYGGTFKRFWLDATTLTSTSGNYYGLFPMGTVNASSYRPVQINTTGNITTAGYFTVNHTDADVVTDLSPVYNDAGTNITRIHNAQFNTAISGVTAGTFSVSITMTNLDAGTIGDIRLAKFTGGTTASAVGTHAAATGTAPNPTAIRTGITTMADLNGDFRISTTNVTNTPLRQFYYSINAGNWNDVVNVWSYTAGGAACGCSPSTGGHAYITSLGTPISVTVPATVGYLDINTGAILDGTSNLTVTYDMVGSGTGAFGPTTGAWTVNRNVTLTGTSTYTTSSTGLTVVGDLTLSGTTLVLGAGLTISGHLVANGTITAGSNNITMDGTAKNISGTGTISGTGSITVSNDKTILAGSSPTITPTFAISGAATITNNGTITLQNNLTGTVAGSTWTNAANSVLNITGDLLLTGTLNASASPNTVQYNGGAAQTIKTPASTYYNLTIANTSGGVSLAANVTTSNTLTLTSGVVTTGANVLILSNTTAANLTYTNGFVYGNLRRYIASNTSTYDFPVGDGTASTDRHLLSFINNSIVGVSYLSASITDFTQSAPNNDAALSTTQSMTQILSTIGSAAGQTDTWTLTPDVAPTGGSYGVRLYVENTTLTAAADDMFCPLKRDAASVTYADFLTYDGSTTIPAAGAAGRIYSTGSGYAQRTGYTSFSQFVIGKGNVPLPVELLTFEAKPDGNIVNVQWVTATEFNSDYFLVQHSTNGIDFSDVIRIKAAGNSSTTRKYAAEDYEPYKGVSYYRLKQVDYDGKFSYSDVVAVQLHNEDAISVYPNPTKQGEPFNVSISGKKGNEVLVVIHDVQGREFYSKLNIIASDTEVIAIDPSGKLAAGLYFVVATSNDAIYEKKIVVK